MADEVDPWVCKARATLNCNPVHIWQWSTKMKRYECSYCKAYRVRQPDLVILPKGAPPHD